ncbi:MAG TPA: hypothetical protein VNG93_10345 [Candidatus Dormibacteraeota bacterium]|nr:hypothetical protein [Candidatus Dormibacteraeota bacterium]
MADQPPELLERIGATTAGEVWRARSAAGKEVLASQTRLADEGSREAGLDRLRRIARVADRRLMPIRGWWADAAGVWVVSDLEQGVGLPDLPGGGFLSPQQAAAISFSVLEGLKALHSEGLSHGDLTPEHLRVLPDGGVVLTGHQLSTLALPSQEDLAAEIRQAGRIICQAFGITPERTSGAPRAIEHAAPALVVTARAIAAGSMRADVGSALTAMRETAGPLASPERLAAGGLELGSLVGGNRGGNPGGELRFRSLSAPTGSGSFAHRPPPTPPPDPTPPPPSPPAPQPQPAPAPIPAQPVAAAALSPAPDPAQPAARRSWEERQATPAEDYVEERQGPNWALIGGGILVLLILALGIWFGRGLLGGASNTASNTPGPTAGSSSRSATSKPPATGKPVGTPTPAPGALPTFAPASAGQVKDVTIKQSSPSCSPGVSCTFEVVVDVNSPGTSSAVTWSFKVFDPCSGSTTSMDGGSITPVNGPWTSFDGNTAITLPSAKGQLDVVAISGPTDVAASSPLQVGAGGC